ncbi:hypothetical protein ACKWTF_010226 [Chironomus riparius]
MRTTPTTTTTTTEEPEATTKKKGFFSGISGFFKGNKDKDKDKSTTTSTTTTTTKKPAVTSTAAPTTAKIATPPPLITTTTQKPIPTTAKAIVPQQPVTPKQNVPSTPSTTVKTTVKDDFPPLPGGRPQQTPTQPQRFSPPPIPTKKDDFPPLPSVTGRPQQPGVPTTSTPAVPNAWNVKPQIPTDKPVSFFSQPPPVITTTTRRPQVQTQGSRDSESKATDAELLTLSDSLFSKDIYNPFKFVIVNYQGRTQSSATTDEASQPLLQIDEKLYSVNTVEKMKLMFNNYEQDTSINEYVTPIERKEENDFIDAVLLTPVMRHAMNFLTQKGVVTADPATHKELLKTIWFGMYSRGHGKISSSGFEHVFMSEVKEGNVIGLHNYIYLTEQEKSRDVDYKGWLKKIDLGNKGQIAKIRFALNGLDKPSNSLFIGTSPELELALYTVCFEVRPDQECRMAYGGKDFNIVTHTFRYRGTNYIGSAYPEI